MGGDPLQERDRLLLSVAGIDDDTRAQVERIAIGRDMPLAPLYGALLDAMAVKPPIDYAVRETLLTRAADDFVKVRNEQRMLAWSDPEVARLRAQAERHMLLGNYQAARGAVVQARSIDGRSREQLERRLQERDLSEAASASIGAGYAEKRGLRIAMRRSTTPLRPIWRSARTGRWHGAIEPTKAMRSIDKALSSATTQRWSMPSGSIAVRWRWPRDRPPRMRTTGLRRRSSWALRSHTLANGRAARGGWRRRSGPIARRWKSSPTSGSRSIGRGDAEQSGKCVQSPW